MGLGHNAGIGTGEAVVLRGGPRGSSDFVDLGDDLLSGLTDATIEIWARPIQVQQWSRIFDFGSGTDNYLTMAWTRGENPGSDLIEWVGNGEKTTANASLAPYELGREYHIVMTIEGTRSDGMTRVRLYKDGNFEGAFSTSLTLADLEDTNMALGQSQFGADHTASASYNELRIYDGVLSAAEIASNTANPPTPLPPVEPYGFVLGAGTFDGHGQGGNLAGGSPFTDHCAPGSAIYRFSGQFQSSGVVARLRAHCAPLVFAPDFSPARFRRGAGDQTLPTHGSNTGQPFDLVCPQNQFVRGLHVHTSSGGLHSFTIFCAEFQVEQQSDPPFYRVDWGATFLLGEGQAVGTLFGDNNPPRIIDRYRGHRPRGLPHRVAYPGRRGRARHAPRQGRRRPPGPSARSGGQPAASRSRRDRRLHLDSGRAGHLRAQDRLRARPGGAPRAAVDREGGRVAVRSEVSAPPGVTPWARISGTHTCSRSGLNEQAAREPYVIPTLPLRGEAYRDAGR